MSNLLSQNLEPAAAQEAPQKPGSSMTASTKALSRQAEPVRDRVPEDVQKAPEQALTKHEILEKVKVMIVEALEPYRRALPAVRSDVASVENSVRDYQVVMKSQQR